MAAPSLKTRLERVAARLARREGELADLYAERLALYQEGAAAKVKHEQLGEWAGGKSAVSVSKALSKAALHR